MNELIAYLTAIKGYAKNIHYTCHSGDFYSKHIFADLISDPIADFIDKIKEVCLLGHFPVGERPLETSKYDKMASLLYPNTSESDDKANFKRIQELIITTLNLIEKLEGLTKGEENLIGAIAEHLQQMNGLLNLQNFFTEL